VIIRRRRVLPAHLVPAYDAFSRVLDHIEPAKAALADVLPSTRMPGRPLSDALLAFERGMSEARMGMQGWRRPEVEAEWQDCLRGVDEALSKARHLRQRAPAPPGFEALLATVQSLLDPLDPFHDAARRFSSLRRR
jgi:hypothetical protein